MFDSFLSKTGVFFILSIVLLECDSGSFTKGCVQRKAMLVCPAKQKTQEEACSSENEVMITVSPLIDKTTSRRLEINWYVQSVEPGDVIRLYKQPYIYSAHPVYEVVPKSTYGISVTNIMESFLNIGLKFQPVCMGYWVAYWRDNKVLYSSCLQTNPLWMQDYKSYFASLKLFDMFIPGTHDSSAYHTIYKPQITNETRLEMYVYTQEESILEQLLHGARYLDIRVGRDGDVYYAHHGIARLYAFQEVLDHIVTFIENTNELVIADFHDFPVGFPDDKEHEKFVDFLFEQLSQYLVSPTLTWYATLQQVWRTGRRLILSYNNPKMVEKFSDILWPPITQMWGNKQNVTELYDYLEEVFKKPPQGMWSAQAELTAKAQNIVINDLGGLRQMASRSNTLVTKWFRGEWGDTCHIVAMDFIRASAIVDVAIESNMRRSKKLACLKKKEQSNNFLDFNWLPNIDASLLTYQPYI